MSLNCQKTRFRCSKFQNFDALKFASYVALVCVHAYTDRCKNFRSKIEAATLENIRILLRSSQILSSVLLQKICVLFAFFINRNDLSNPLPFPAAILMLLSRKEKKKKDSFSIWASVSETQTIEQRPIESRKLMSKKKDFFFSYIFENLAFMSQSFFLHLDYSSNFWESLKN